MGRKISVEQAMRTSGAAVLRNPQPGAVGHVAISDGRRGTVEAHSTKAGVIASTISGRRWDTGILVPQIEFSERDADDDATHAAAVSFQAARGLVIDGEVGRARRARWG